jgi:hypothetical protein
LFAVEDVSQQEGNTLVVRMVELDIKRLLEQLYGVSDNICEWFLFVIGLSGNMRARFVRLGSLRDVLDGFEVLFECEAFHDIGALEAGQQFAER